MKRTAVFAGYAFPITLQLKKDVPMLTLRILATACAFAACLNSTVGFAAEDQRWSVQIVDDTAIVRASEKTEFKFVQATVTALQESGMEKFTLRVNKPTDKIGDTKLTFSIRIIDGSAEITSSTDIPYKYLEKTIKKLSDAGVRKMKFASTGRSTDEAIPR